MQLPTIICIVFWLACAFAVSTVRVPDNARELYEQFKQDYGKLYTNDDDEKRFAIFKDNLVRAQTYQMHERGTAEYGVTQFFDLTPEEFAAKYLNSPIDDQMEYEQLNDLKAAPEHIDWREKGAVAPVENQGKCGSCWAFAVVGNVEGQWFLKTGQLLSLSKQQLVDCDVVDRGCNGGWTRKTYGEIIRMGGLEAQQDYPYIARKQECRLDKSKLVAKIDSSIALWPDERKHAAWLAEHGPVVASLNANYLQYYRSGISHPSRHECNPKRTNHAVLTVGYGTENGIPYWIIKNSWGVRWGESGYFRLYRGDGTCGIEKSVSSAIIR
ncbi:Cysteine proteinase Cathepsin L [Paragonimus heterotremus]|uniref:Cysteine proteinase Cathepsin L n=1 Tax=Paragonimus heterotremus TaxID=100268 RepID=A0A8J4SQI9_9TREM|nr:Cysteine proteinase Cathepsin L [Paragonimus heterotremus]